MASTQTRTGFRQTLDKNTNNIFVNLSNKNYRQVTEDMVFSEAEAFGEYLNLISDQDKVLIPLTDSFYHFWHDEVGIILTYHNYDKNIKIVIDEGRYDGSVSSGMIKFLFKALDYHKVNYVKINSKSLDGFLINNLISIPRNPALRFNIPETLYDFFKPFIKNPDNQPYRKAYFSRSALPDRDFSETMTDEEQFFPYHLHHDNRIDSHKKIEDFFRSKGFEIVVPEKDFESFEDQLNYVYTVKTFASLTSSGLTNTAFMQPNQTVIELVTPLLMSRFGRYWMEEIHL